MQNFSIFDIIGPVMIGPSSSHTAGAARVAYMARQIIGSKVKSVDFYLHGSFAQTYKGHGTDKALLAGICGLHPDDERIVDAFSYAKTQGVSWTFQQADLGDVHPNTVKMCITDLNGHQREILGSSIGGGNAVIVGIDGIEVSITGKYATLMTEHKDQPGIIAEISHIFAEHRVNIAFMKLYRENKGENAILVLEMDGPLDIQVVQEVQKMPQILKLTYFEALTL